MEHRSRMSSPLTQDWRWTPGLVVQRWLYLWNHSVCRVGRSAEANVGSSSSVAHHRENAKRDRPCPLSGWANLFLLFAVRRPSGICLTRTSECAFLDCILVCCVCGTVARLSWRMVCNRKEWDVVWDWYNSAMQAVWNVPNVLTVHVFLFSRQQTVLPDTWAAGVAFSADELAKGDASVRADAAWTCGHDTFVCFVSQFNKSPTNNREWPWTKFGGGRVRTLVCGACGAFELMTHFAWQIGSSTSHHTRTKYGLDDNAISGQDAPIHELFRDGSRANYLNRLTSQGVEQQNPGDFKTAVLLGKNPHCKILIFGARAALIWDTMGRIQNHLVGDSHTRLFSLWAGAHIRKRIFSFRVNTD